MSDAGGAAVPTGCFKCGRPGHWSRDCPSSNPNNPNPNPNFSSTSTSYPKSTNNFSKSSGTSSFPPKSAAKPKKAPRTRPKLTPELLLSDEGLGYILRYFPRNFKYRGRGYEVNDLRNLLRMYAEWHEQFLPYFPFDQFIHKVEEVGSSKRLKTCIAELKDRVANGGDPTKLKESATETEIQYDKEDVQNVEEPTHNQEDLPFADNDADDIHEDLLNEIFNRTVEEQSISRQSNSIGADMPPTDKSTEHPDQSVGVGGGSSNIIQITEEQKLLMEAKRQKALEKAAARSRLLPTS
ncbi:TIMELESS-interacting protein [Bienertia sinuspersici]